MSSLHEFGDAHLGVDLSFFQLFEKELGVQRQLRRMDARRNPSLGQPDGRAGRCHARGQRPFAGDSPLATLTAILTRPLFDLQQLCPDASDGLTDLVYRMLEKDPAARIPSVRMVGTELETILEAAKSPTADGQLPTPAYRPLPTTSRFATPTPSTERPRHNLPVQVTPFVGREAELSELSRLLADPNVHLVTVLGPGGMGKTRLALRAAEMLARQFPHKSLLLIAVNCNDNNLVAAIGFLEAAIVDKFRIVPRIPDFQRIRY